MKVARSGMDKGSDSRPKKLAELKRGRPVAAAPGAQDSTAPDIASDDMDQVVTMLGEMDIDFSKMGADDAAPPSTEKQAQEEWPEEQPEVEEERPISESADPVRMYLQEMGSVPLLSREEEVAIAKGIEAGENAVRAAVFALDIALRYVIGLADALRRAEIDVREVFGDEEQEVDATEQRDNRRVQGFFLQVTRLKRFAAEQEKVRKELRPKKTKLSKVKRECLVKRRAKLAKSTSDLLNVVPIGKAHIAAIVDKLKETEVINARAVNLVRRHEVRTGKQIAELLHAAQLVRAGGKNAVKAVAGLRRINATQVVEAAETLGEARRAALAGQRELGLSSDELVDVIHRIGDAECSAKMEMSEDPCLRVGIPIYPGVSCKETSTWRTRARCEAGGDRGRFGT